MWYIHSRKLSLCLKRAVMKYLLSAEEKFTSKQCNMPINFTLPMWTRKKKMPILFFRKLFRYFGMKFHAKSIKRTKKIHTTTLSQSMKKYKFTILTDLELLKLFFFFLIKKKTKLHFF